MVEKSELTASAPDWWSQFYGPIRHFGERVAEFFSPSSEAAATADSYEISVELPGVGEKDISVEVHDGRLTVKGEKSSSEEKKGKNFYFSERVYGKFQRVFRLPVDADTENVSASHKDGVLTVNIAKLATSTPTPTKIEIVKH